jgi:ABC-type glycerol-3-phosphate transport system substrate-binding protein
LRFVRAFLIACLTAVAVAVVLFAGRSKPGPEQGRVVVRYWEKWTGTEAEQMQVIVNDFNNTVGKQKGIYVEYLSMSNVNQKTLVSTAAGVPPDVAGIWQNNLPQFASMDALQPLDDLAASHGITADYYQPVYWQHCHFNGRLWALISTPSTIALHYNKRLFLERAASLRAAGLDPNRAPRTIDELDRYAAALNVVQTTPDGRTQIKSAGYLTMEPGWYLAYTDFWFGGHLYDEKTGKLTLTSPEMIQAFRWIQSFSKHLGKDAMTDFTSGLGQFASAQNGFLTGNVVMEQQGPWMANYIETLRPSMNRWHFPKAQEKGMSLEKRRENYEWGVVPFPSSVPGVNDATFADFDALVIPRGARHPKEAFEFIAYVNRQDVMEKLCSLHCKNSPLRKVSAAFIQNHPNPYIDVFQRLAASPHAQGVPPVPIWPEVADELSNTAQRVYLLQATPEQALADAQARLQAKLDDFRARQRERNGGGAADVAPATGVAP